MGVRWTPRKIADLCESVADGFTLRECDRMLAIPTGESAKQFGLIAQAWAAQEEGQRLALKQGLAIDFYQGDVLIGRLEPGR